MANCIHFIASWGLTRLYFGKNSWDMLLILEMYCSWPFVMPVYKSSIPASTRA